MHRGIGAGDRPHGVGVDAAPEVRPGVPREWAVAEETGAHWVAPERQPGPDANGRTGLRVRTPVFGTAQPARCVSGALRRLAYRLPEHRSARWVALLAADRVDVLEHRLGRALWLVPALAALGAGYAAVSRALARR
jgi:hypothetical protein